MMDVAIFEPAAEIKRSWGGNGIGQRAQLEKDKGPNYVAVSIIVIAITDLSGPQTTPWITLSILKCDRIVQFKTRILKWKLYFKNPETVIHSALYNWLYNRNRVTRVTGLNRMTRVMGEVSIIIFGMSKSSGFPKYSICWVFQALCLCLCLCRCLCHCLCICICVLLWFLNSSHHKVSKYVWA